MTTSNHSSKDRGRAPVMEKMTLTYVATEDRMRLVGAGKSGDAVLLWLTQRMCNQIVQILTNCLEKLAETRGVLAKDAVLSFQQSDARQNLPSLPPVTVGPEATATLVRTIEVQQTGKRFVLAFKAGKASCAEIAFGAPDVHRWLTVLHGLYIKAGWAMQFWPEWFEDPDRKSAARTTLLH